MLHSNKLNYNEFPSSFPAQHQSIQPGVESQMTPLPIFDDPNYKGSNKLLGKVCLITGGDSGIGRAVAIAFAKEGARLAISYRNEDDDANETCRTTHRTGPNLHLSSIQRLHLRLRPSPPRQRRNRRRQLNFPLKTKAVLDKYADLHK